MPRGSAAYVIAVVAIMSFIIGGLVYASLDPMMQAIFDSELWTSSTTHGKNALEWQKRIWLFAPTFVLVSIVTTIWIETRQPT